MRPDWERDGIQLYCADCMDVLPQIRKSCDLVVTSPPYNCGMDYGEYHDNLPNDDYFAWIEACFQASANAVRPSGRMVVNLPNWVGSRDDQVFAFEEYKAILDRHMIFRDFIIWDKGPPNGAAWGNYPNSPRIRAGHEWLLVYQSNSESPAGSDIDWSCWSRFTQSPWRIQPKLPYADFHPATFPVEVPYRAIMLYSPKESKILDPFMGTGSTVEASVKAGRTCIGIEKSRKYFDIAVKRIERALSEERSSLFPVSKEIQRELI